MHHLVSIFNIDIYAYATMPNHYHIVLHIDEQHNESLTDKEAYERWCQLCSKLVLVERWQSGQTTLNMVGVCDLPIYFELI